MMAYAGVGLGAVGKVQLVERCVMLDERAGQLDEEVGLEEGRGVGGV